MLLLTRRSVGLWFVHDSDSFSLLWKDTVPETPIFCETNHRSNSWKKIPHECPPQKVLDKHLFFPPRDSVWYYPGKCTVVSFLNPMEVCATLKFIPDMTLLLLVEEQAKHYCLNRNSRWSFQSAVSILNEHPFLGMNTNFTLFDYDSCLIICF